MSIRPKVATEVLPTLGGGNVLYNVWWYGIGYSLGLVNLIYTGRAWAVDPKQ